MQPQTRDDNPKVTLRDLVAPEISELLMQCLAHSRCSKYFLNVLKSLERAAPGLGLVLRSRSFCWHRAVVARCGLRVALS